MDSPFGKPKKKNQMFSLMGYEQAPGIVNNFIFQKLKKKRF